MSDTNEDSTISLAEFKAWLQGVEEMQDADWAPTLVQWRRIRAKFMLIEQSGPPTRRHMTYAEQPHQYGPAYAPEQQSRPQPLPPGLTSGLGGKTKTPDIDSTNGYNSNFV